MNSNDVFVLPSQLPIGQDGFTHYGHVWVTEQNGERIAFVCMRAPLFPEGDARHMVLVSKCPHTGMLRVFCEDTEHARRPCTTPCLQATWIEVPTVRFDADEFGGDWS